MTPQTIQDMVSSVCLTASLSVQFRKRAGATTLVESVCTGSIVGGLLEEQPSKIQPRNRQGCGTLATLEASLAFTISSPLQVFNLHLPETSDNLKSAITHNLADCASQSADMAQRVVDTKGLAPITALLYR
eukprot:1183085-Prorocentrum_minimum.AAC.6